MIKLSKNICFVNVLVCDDIRQEKSEKYILIGAYSGGIFLSSFPATVPLAFYIEMRAGTDAATFWFRMSGPGKGSAKMRIDYQKENPDEPVMTFVIPMQVLMEEAGTFKLEASLDQKKWTKILAKEVTQKSDLWHLGPSEILRLSEQPQTAVQET